MAMTNTTKQNPSTGHQIPSDILDDLASRFIINVPVDERNNLIRICFQIELAHWFYLDFFCSIEEKKLVPCGIKQFASHIFHHIPFLRIHLSTIDKILEDWKQYKLSVPTYGAILMSEDLKYVLLVQSYWAKSSWGFPKGKVNEHEDPIHCATREVFEETGYDITGLIVPNDYIEAVINYQYTRLYLVRNVPLQTLFSPRTRKEIKCCEWFPVDSLPINKSDTLSKANLGINANSFFMIMPFIKRLKKWVHEHIPSADAVSTPYLKIMNIRKIDLKTNGGNVALNLNNSNCKNKIGCNGKRQRHKSMGDIDIKLSLTNCNNSATKLFSGTKSSLTPNDVNDACNDNFNVKREKYLKMNSKRQLFSNCSINGSAGNTNCITNNNTFINNCDFDMKEINCLQNSSESYPILVNDNNGKINNISNKINNKNNIECINNIEDLESSSSSVTSKISPNLDSWTSFSFTRNFIADVFC